MRQTRGCVSVNLKNLYRRYFETLKMAKIDLIWKTFHVVMVVVDLTIILAVEIATYYRGKTPGRCRDCSWSIKLGLEPMPARCLL